MLSHQIYTPKYCENIKNIFAGREVLSTLLFEEESSPDNLNGVSGRHPDIPYTQANHRTPTHFRRYDVIENANIEKKRCPTSPQNKNKHGIEIDTLDHNEETTYIPVVQYTTHLSNELFDPTIINTPPSEFMNQLKCRLDVYYSASS